MSYQYDYHHPPPPPPPLTPGSAGLGPGLSPGGHPIQRRRPISGIQPPAIATNFAGGSPTIGQGGFSSYTPASASPWSSGGHNAPQSQFAIPGTPMEPYNPRQWGNRGGQVSGQQMLFQQQRPGIAPPPSTSEITGMEAAMPSPPPPYTPSSPDAPHRGGMSSAAMENIGTVVSPLATEPPARQSPQISVSPAFPPPPGPSSRHRERSSSGLAGQRGFFGLSGLRGKQPEPAPTSIPAAPPVLDMRPPSARRAASTGHMMSHGIVASSSSSPAGPARRDSPESGWQPGMPLPGPPPRPPSSDRSQSLSRPLGGAGSSSTDPHRQLEAPRTRRPLPTSNLGPVPPTPADWVVGAPNPPSAPMPERPHLPVDGATMEPLRIDTTSHREPSHREPSLTRRPAQRGESASGLRDRRSRSRAQRGDEEGAGPSNLVFSPVEGSISRRREHARTRSHYVEPHSAPSTSTTMKVNGPSPATTKPGDNVLTPPYTPAVGRNVDEQLRKQVLKAPGSATSDRAVTHLIPMPNEDANGSVTPGRPPSAGFRPPTAKLDSFALQAIERHRHFVEQEINARTDEERLELFANFMVHESRIRRDRYPSAYNAMAGEIVDLMRDMWRSFTKNGRRTGTPSTGMSSYDPTVPSSQPGSARGSSFGDCTPGTDGASNGDPNEHNDRSEGRQWPEAFKPSLSPIPSMAVSTAPDESDSRGRSASRWWEQSVTGPGSIGRPDRMEKTRRETKYMGITAAALRDSSPDPSRHTPNGQRNAPASGYGPDEYPPEKVGWHDSYDYDTPMPTPHQNDRIANTPGVDPLDVSRLVTLPPPYPRHHPALSNNHPLLADLRNEHRILIQRDDIQKIKDTYNDKDAALLQEQAEASKQRRAKLRASIQSKIADGSMSFADAAKAEADFETEEGEKSKVTARANFDVFEASVSHPLNTLLQERLNKANQCIQQLTTDLESGDEAANPNQAQEEGDERPERLEKLTLLKWFFEARELLHKEMFDLHGMRSEKYAEVILTPYRLAKQQSKIDEAAAFFEKDGRERQITLAKEALKRSEELQAVVDRNVTRGVEDQLSAFWDIAPGLLEIVQQISTDDVESLEILIPPQEYAENPAYHEHPLQYLYSLLNHAHKSAYQFIESQINLLCLLHEVKTATTTSSLRLVEMERHAAVPAATAATAIPEITAEMKQARREAEGHLTSDLKEKVGDVERQWNEALGEGMAECRARVGGFLEESGGLEDGLEV